MMPIATIPLVTADQLSGRRAAAPLQLPLASVGRFSGAFLVGLIEPDVRIARIRLSDKNSRLHPRHVVPTQSSPHFLK